MELELGLDEAEQHARFRASLSSSSRPGYQSRGDHGMLDWRGRHKTVGRLGGRNVKGPLVVLAERLKKQGKWVVKMGKQTT